ncbi:helix-hairpin-helix domain-containing protein [Mediterranea massiliensis]|uniref:Helix-hairpin-helix domain-containing protein n=1 Tax=Mediterranea massiliensis TaxID=1841865 RepID=A0ABS2DZQ5_9BACT|nr:helix-hairpin-helix domain-containing protein [Mediterranea massiliensis]MBM6734857.1 helix-hairpin-helix domain-containing protein [Mediterranea massiliensis]
MRYIRIGIGCLLSLVCLALQAQHPDLMLWEENLEQLAADAESTDWEDELEELSRRMKQKLNLNTATREELEQFPFLSEEQVENLLAYVHVHGAMQTLYELQLVETMDKETIGRLLPFVCVRPLEEETRYPSLKNILKYGRHEATARFDLPFYTRKGYEKDYLGPSMYHSLRYSFRYGDRLQVGVTGEKDAGEPFFALHDRQGYDYYSFYLLLKGWGRLETLAVGNYRVSFGQGLVLGNGFGLGKTFSLATAEYRTEGFRKHSSSDEYNYFRGVGGTVRLVSRWRVSAFYSHRDLDGVVEDGEITSIYKTGLHRTAKEAAKRHAFVMQAAGGNVAYGGRHLKVGVTGLYYFFDRPYEPTLRKYARYNLRGNRFYNVGVDYAYRSGRWALVGEAAKGKRGYAFLNQLRYQVGGQYKVMLIHRYYSHDYWGMFARSFGESSALQNENGWFLAGEASPFARWRFFGGIDLFSFPWWKYRISKPSQGVDGLFQVTFTPNRRWSMYTNYRLKRKERDVTGSGGETILPTLHHKVRYRLSYAQGLWNLRTTADYNRFVQAPLQCSQGWQVTQMCGVRLPFLPLAATLQGTYFHTDDYDSRVYAYEKGLLYTFYTPSFYGRGFRFSAHLRYDFRDWLMLIAKFGQTLYQDREEIGSGNDLIRGNKKSDLQVQVRLKF